MVGYKVLGCAMVVHCLTLLAPNKPVAMYKKQMHGRLTWLRTFTTSCFSNLFFPKILILNAPTFSPSHNPAAETISTNARITTRCILRYVCRMNSAVEAVCFYVSARSITGTSYTQVYFQTACACVRISYVRLHVPQHLQS